MTENPKIINLVCAKGSPATLAVSSAEEVKIFLVLLLYKVRFWGCWLLNEL